MQGLMAMITQAAPRAERDGSDQADVVSVGQGLWYVVAAYAGILLLFWPTVSSLIEAWGQSRTYAHGFLIFPATLYVLSRYRDQFAAVPTHPSVGGMLWLGVTAAMWAIARRWNIEWLEQVAVISMFPALIGAVLGMQPVSILAFPLGLLAFALPVGTSIQPWLQDFTAGFIMVGLALVRIPASLDGYFISMPTGTWEVAPDCGGLRYLLPGLALGYLYVAVLYRDPIRRLVYLVICGAALMLANGLRAYAIIVSDHLGIVEGADHRFFSYSIYGLTMAALFWFGRRWQAPRTPALPDARRLQAGATRQACLATAIVAVALVAAAPLTVWVVNRLA